MKPKSSPCPLLIVTTSTISIDEATLVRSIRYGDYTLRYIDPMCSTYTRLQIDSSSSAAHATPPSPATPPCSPAATSGGSSSRNWIDSLMISWAWIQISLSVLVTLLFGLSLAGLGSLSSVVLPCLVLTLLLGISYCHVTILLLFCGNGPTAPPRF